MGGGGFTPHENYAIGPYRLFSQHWNRVLLQSNKKSFGNVWDSRKINLANTSENVLTTFVSTRSPVACI